MKEDTVDILLVDDSPAKLLALEAALGPLGERIHKATSGSEALRLLLSHEFAVILLDAAMPVMDGFETAKLIRGRERSAHTPIIFVSAVRVADSDLLRGYGHGAVDYMPVPIVPEVLRAKVGAFVDLYRKTQQLAPEPRAGSAPSRGPDDPRGDRRVVARRDPQQNAGRHHHVLERRRRAQLRLGRAGGHRPADRDHRARRAAQ